MNFVSMLEDWATVAKQWQPPRPSPVIGETVLAPPLVGSTQTFITAGNFDNPTEAVNCNKYINTKFVKALLSILKVTQHNPPATWQFVPLQDFTNNSDIDWSGSLADIDAQLYRKYNLDDAQIKFIESHFCYHPRFDEKAELAARRCTEDV